VESVALTYLLRSLITHVTAPLKKKTKLIMVMSEARHLLSMWVFQNRLYCDE